MLFYHQYNHQVGIVHQAKKLIMNKNDHIEYVDYQYLLHHTNELYSNDYYNEYIITALL